MTTIRSAVGRPFTTDLTPDQRRSYTQLSTAIADAIDNGQSVPCLRLPGLFDLSLAKPTTPAADDEDRVNRLVRRRELAALRARLCDRCPVLQECGEYATSGVQVYGFLAGSWRRGR